MTSLARRLYGDRVFHLIILLAALALTGYTIAVLGLDELFRPSPAWWQSIVVWFALAIIAHDLVLFPLYALADRLLPRSSAKPRDTSGRIPLTNYLRMPTLAAGLLFLMFFPGIIGQGAKDYLSATGQNQEPFLGRWLLLTASFYLASALWYVVKTVVRQRHSAAESATVN